MKRKLNLLIILTAGLFLTFCTPQGRVASRLSNEWNIDRFEQRSATGEVSAVQNAGILTLSSGGRGSQTFTTAIVHAGGSATSEFRWSNTARTVTIKLQDATNPKVWIIVESGRSRQLWYSTDSLGNVQVMELSRK